MVIPTAASTEEFSAIYDAEVSFVGNCLRRLGVPAHDLEDKVQDVFVVVYRKLGEYDKDRPLRPWLTGIATRMALDHLRKVYTRREELCDASEIAPAGAERDPEQQMVDAQAQQLVLDALDRMELDRRSVFVLHDIEGYSMPEIAAMIDAPLNTLYSRLRLARQQFTTTVRRLGARRAA